MAKTGRQMSAMSVGIKTGVIVVEDGVDKVTEMIPAAAEFFDHVHIFIKCGAIVVLNLNKIALGTMRDNANLGAPVIVRFQSSRFKYKRLAVAVIVNRDLSIGRVARVDIIVVATFRLISQTSAIRNHAGWELINAKERARNVGLVRTLIAKIAVSIKTLPMPIIVEIRTSRWIDNRSGTRPKIIIHRLGNLIFTKGADRFATFIT